MSRLSSITVAAVLVVCTATLGAQKTTEVHPGKAGTPHVKSEWTVDGAAISITYGKVALKGRTPGKDVDPYDGKEWRTGADEATTLVTNRPLKFGDVSLPAGTYTLYTMPAGSAWQLIISKKTGQWGIPYPKGEDLGRVAMTVAKAASPADALAFTVTDTATGGTLRIDWGGTSASAAFTVG